MILYHPGKANMVVDALSHKFMGSLAYIIKARRLLVSEMHGLKANGAKHEINKPNVLLAHVEHYTSFSKYIKVA